MTATTRSGRVQWSDRLTLIVLAMTFATSVISYDMVPANIVVHYTPSWGLYYGPETLPRSIGLFIVPVIGTITVALIRGLTLVDELREQLTPIRPYYRASIVVTACVFCVTQVALLLLNLT